MAKVQAAILAFLFFATAGSAAFAQEDFEQQIAGKWRVSIEKTRAYLKDRSLATDDDEDFLKAMGDLAVEFSGEGAVTVNQGGSEQMKGQWKLVKDEDGQFVIDLIREEESTRTTIEFLDPNSIAIAPQNERPLVLTRVGKDAVEGIAAKLIGAWECDRKATLALESNKEFTQEQLDEMMQEAGGMLVTFAQDGTFSATTIAGEDIKELSGTWTASDVDEAKGTFQLALEAERGPDTLKVELRSDGSICFSPPDEPSAVFVRKAEKGGKLP